MPVIVSLRAVIEQMDLMSDEATAYINRKNGELITLTHEELALRRPRGGRRRLSVAERPPAEGARGPGFGGLSSLARSLTDDAVSDELDAALNGRGAFRRFKDAVHRLGIADEWYRFRDAALEEIAIDFLEAHGIAYQRESPQN